MAQYIIFMQKSLGGTPGSSTYENSNSSAMGGEGGDRKRFKSVQVRSVTKCCSMECSPSEFQPAMLSSKMLYSAPPLIFHSPPSNRQPAFYVHRACWVSIRLFLALPPVLDSQSTKICFTSANLVISSNLPLLSSCAQTASIRLAGPVLRELVPHGCLCTRGKQWQV